MYLVDLFKGENNTKHDWHDCDATRFFLFCCLFNLFTTSSSKRTTTTTRAFFDTFLKKFKIQIFQHVYGYVLVCLIDTLKFEKSR